MLHKTGIHLFLLRNGMLRCCSKLKETSFIRIFHESPKLRRIWFVWRVFLENWKQAHAILRDENHAMDTYAIQWRTAKCLPVRKIFLVLLWTVVSKIQFFCAGCYFKNQPWLHRSNCKDQYLPKKRSRTNKRTAIKKTCLFFGLWKELHLT